jgi:hypothetical protein
MWKSSEVKIQYQPSSLSKPRMTIAELDPTA